MTSARIRTVAAAVGLAVSAAGWSHGQAIGQLETAAGESIKDVAVALPQGAAVAARHQDGAYRPWPGSDGREEAARECQKADFDSDKRACLQVVGGARYFDVRAAAACGNRDFSSNVPKCMAAIANKEYLDAEVDVCAGNSFDSGAIACFQSAGRPYVHAPPYDPRPGLDSYILARLRRIEAELRRGSVAAALFDVVDLIRFIEAGMRYPR